MATTINASTSAGLVSTADTSGVLQLQTANTTAVSVSAAQVVNFTNAPTVGTLTSGRVTYAGTSGVLQDSANLTFDGTNLSLAAGNLVVSNGKGIDFSATPGTGTSELLADYEEGTWTPSLGGTTTYTAQRGTYTKIGRLVYVTGVIVVSAIGTGSTIAISGLPFTARAQDSGGVQATYFNSAATSLVFATGNTDDGATTFRFYSLTAAAATTGANAVFGTGTQVNFVGAYIV